MFVSKPLGASTQSLFTFSCLREASSLATVGCAHASTASVGGALHCASVLRGSPCCCWFLSKRVLWIADWFRSQGDGDHQSLWCSLNPVLTFGSLVTASTLLAVATFRYWNLYMFGLVPACSSSPECPLIPLNSVLLERTSTAEGR